MKIHCLQHIRHERPGSIQRWARARGHEIGRTSLGDGEPLPPAASFDALVILGGPMSVKDEAAHPWLAPEKALIAAAIRSGKRVLGICLGAQLIAEVLGARVSTAKEKEIGWFPVRRSPAAGRLPLGAAVPAEVLAFHWHAETFDLPSEAIHLASSDVCANQAFAWGRHVLGLQFHLEVSGDIVQDMVRHGFSDIVEGPHIQRADVMLWEPGRFDRANTALDGLLDTLFV